MYPAIAFGAAGLLVVVLIVLASTPRARSWRAAVRAKLRETAEFRAQVSANAHRTYDRQFPNRRRAWYAWDGGAVHSSGDGGGGWGCDSGGGDGC